MALVWQSAQSLLFTNVSRLDKVASVRDTVRDFVDMSDFLDLVDIALETDAPTGVFNVSSGEGHSIIEVFNAVADCLGMMPPEPPLLPPGSDDVREVVLDPGKTEKTFGWKTEVGFQETIVNQLRLYDEYGIDAIYSHLASPTTRVRESKPT